MHARRHSARITYDEGSSCCGGHSHFVDAEDRHEKRRHRSGVRSVAADGRAFPALRQPEMLALARDRLAPGIDVDEFVRQNLADDDLRRRRSRALGADALPVTYPRRTLRSL